MSNEGNNDDAEYQRSLKEALEKSKEPDKKIVIQHQFVKGGDSEDLQKELDTKTTQLELLSLKKFEDEKAKLLETVPSDKKSEVEAYIREGDPERLETAKLMYGSSEEPRPKRPPSGIVRQFTERDDKPENPVSAVYDILEDLKTTDEEKQIADSMRKDMLGELFKGLKIRGKRHLDLMVMECPNCKGVLTYDIDTTGRPCPYCGYDPRAELAKKIERGEINLESSQ